MGILDSISRKLQGVDRIGKQKLELNIKRWINSDPLTLKELKGKVVLVEFADLEENKDTIHQLNLWNQMFPSDDFQIVSVYSPEHKVTELAKIKLFVTKRGINYPVAIDNNFKTSTEFKVQFRPTFYLFDRKARLRNRVVSSKDLDRIGTNIMRFIGEK